MSSHSEEAEPLSVFDLLAENDTESDSVGLPEPEKTSDASPPDGESARKAKRKFEQEHEQAEQPVKRAKTVQQESTAIEQKVERKTRLVTVLRRKRAGAPAAKAKAASDRTCAGAELCADSTPEMLAEQICGLLQEQNAPLVIALARELGSHKAIRAYRETAAIERDGGMKLQQRRGGRNRRTAGGVFIFVGRRMVGEQSWARVLAESKQKQQRQHTDAGTARAHEHAQRDETAQTPAVGADATV